MERFQEAGAHVRGPEFRYGLAVERQSIVVLVLVRPANHAQPVRLILDVAPDETAEEAKRIELELPEGIPAPPQPHVLEAQSDRIDRLHQHSFFHPVRPDELEEARPLAEEKGWEGQDASSSRGLAPLQEHLADRLDVAVLVMA